MPPSISLFHISIVVLLVACSALLHTSRSAVPQPPPQTQPPKCQTYDLPNPIASQFPNNATGVLNATLLIVPIPLDHARRLIPAQYGILEGAYRSVLPGFPEGMYPLLVQAAHDHDVQLKAYGITLDDFSRIGLEFPFIDLLGDGSSSFRWAPTQLITSDHDIAISGSAAYGTLVSPASFSPACDAYSSASPSPFPNESTTTTATQFSATSPDGSYASLVVSTLPLSVSTPYPIQAFRNITNQPTFANGSTCDNMIRLFNTSMSRGQHEPVFVRGTVRARLRPMEDGQGQGQGEVEWTDVYGVQVATPFIENNYLDCGSLRGYSGTGGVGNSDVVHSSSGRDKNQEL